MAGEHKASVETPAKFSAKIKIAGINPYVDVPAHVVEKLGGESNLRVLVKVKSVTTTKNGLSRKKNLQCLETDKARLTALRRLAPGDWFRTTLVPMRSDTVRLYLDQWMRKSAGVGVGDHVQVRIKHDPASRELPIPDRLLELLHANEKAKTAWQRLSPSRRREILSYLNFLKTSAALERNIQKTVARLLEEQDNPS